MSTTATVPAAVHEALSGLCEPFPPDTLPALDRPDAVPRSVLHRQWRDDGYVIVPGVVPDDTIDAYCDAWLRAHGQPITVAEQLEPLGWTVDTDRAGGWPDATPYMRVPELRDLACSPGLAALLHTLIGEPMGVHLNLTGWVSTQRDWHQDGYLNPDHVADWYAAAWVALDDISPDAGPFEYVPGTHRWPTIRQAKMLDALGEPPGGLDAQWPKRSERILTPIFEQLLADQALEPEQFVARKGDLLVWHARLLHRGSPPVDPTAERRAVILHYSGITHRPDMPDAVQHPAGGWYFPIRDRTPL